MSLYLIVSSTGITFTISGTIRLTSKEKTCFLNHGAFGATLLPALDSVSKWQRYTERQPLRFFDRELFPFLAKITRRLAKFVRKSSLQNTVVCLILLNGKSNIFFNRLSTA